MPDLEFHISGAEIAAACPSIELRLEVSNVPATEAVQTIVLRCQVQIETPRRRYSGEEQEKLRELFGEPERWSQTLRPMLWTTAALAVPAFAGTSNIGLTVPCTLDFNLNSTKYFHGIEGGTVPLTVMFSGTIFYRTPAGQLQAAPIPWSSQARFDFPVDVWKRCVDRHFPNTACLALRRDSLERLYEYKVRQGLATFDEAIEAAPDEPRAPRSDSPARCSTRDTCCIPTGPPP